MMSACPSYAMHLSNPNSYHTSLMINGDINAIIQCGEEHTVELNSKYKGLNLDDHNNFKLNATVQQREGEDSQYI
jgi:hypothetical protein